MNPEEIDVPAERRNFRRTLARVLGLQVLTLLALWALQVIYSR